MLRCAQGDVRISLERREGKDDTVLSTPETLQVSSPGGWIKCERYGIQIVDSEWLGV